MEEKYGKELHPIPYSPNFTVFSAIVCRKDHSMSKIVKLSRLAVVLSTLFVLGSMTALPVAYADGSQPDATKFCNSKGFESGFYLDAHHIQCYSGRAASTQDIFKV